MERDGNAKITSALGKSVPLLACLSAGLFAIGPVAHSDTNKQIVSVNISSDPQRRVEDLKDLSSFDILGISARDGIAEVAVTSTSLEKLKEMGFQFSFSPLNSQLQREDVEPYLTPSEVLEKIASLAAAHPNMTDVKTIGYTHRKRPIQALVISSAPADKNRPAILFNAMHHARELMTTEVVLHMAEVLLRDYGKDQDVTHWLDTARIILVPQVNPDGNQFVHDGQAMWRKNAWESEGRTFGVDINRNYPALWGSCNGSSIAKGNDSYRGPAAASEPETQAMMNLVTTERPVANISYHSFSEMILYPYGCRKTQNPSLELFKSIGADMKANVVDDAGRTDTYELGTPPELLYEADGTDMDWQFREAGVIAFAMEINSRMQGFQPSFKRWRDLTVTRQEGAWKTLIHRTLDQGVKGRITSRNLSDISYKLTRLVQSQREDFTGDDSSVQPFRARSADGFVFNTLLPGQYEMNLTAGGSQGKTVSFTVREGEITDLGEIRL
ncbi:MAG: Carboxypeptidase precursor [Pseudomonadota bacterium]